MVIYYVLLIVYNFLVSDYNLPTNASPMSSSPAAGNRSQAAPVRPSNLVVFKNYASVSNKVPNEAQLAEWAALANQHVEQMTRFECSEPKPKVIKVKEVHPFASKRFIPNCVVLHRCDDKTGCCADDNFVCTAVRKKRVPMYLYSFVLESGSTQDSSVQTHRRVERLFFSNHTECECRPRKRRLATKLETPVTEPSTTGSSRMGTNKWAYLAVLTLVTFYVS